MTTTYTQVDIANASKFSYHRKLLILLHKLNEKYPFLASHLKVNVRPATDADYYFPPSMAADAIVVEAEITKHLCESISCNSSGVHGPCKKTDPASYYRLGESDSFEVQCNPACFHLFETSVHTDENVDKPQNIRYRWSDKNNTCNIVPFTATWMEIPRYRSSELYAPRLNDLATGFDYDPTTDSYHFNKYYCDVYYEAFDRDTRTCYTKWYNNLANIIVGDSVVKLISAGLTALSNGNGSTLPPLEKDPPPPIDEKWTVLGWRKNVDRTFTLPPVDVTVSDLMFTHNSRAKRSALDFYIPPNARPERAEDAAADEAYAENAAAEDAVADEAYAENAAAEDAVAEDAVADEAYAENAAADEAYAENAAAEEYADTAEVEAYTDGDNLNIDDNESNTGLDASDVDTVDANVEPETNDPMDLDNASDPNLDETPHPQDAPDAPDATLTQDAPGSVQASDSEPAPDSKPTGASETASEAKSKATTLDIEKLMQLVKRLKDTSQQDRELHRAKSSQLGKQTKFESIVRGLLNELTSKDFATSVAVDVGVSQLASQMKNLSIEAIKKLVPLLQKQITRMAVDTTEVVLGASFKVAVREMVVPLTVRSIGSIGTYLASSLAAASTGIGVVLLITQLFSILLTFWDPLGLNNMYSPDYLHQLYENSKMALRAQLNTNRPVLTFDYVCSFLLTEDELFEASIQSYSYTYRYLDSLEVNSDGARINKGDVLDIHSIKFDEIMTRASLFTAEEFERYESQHNTRRQTFDTINQYAFAATAIGGCLILLRVYLLGILMVILGVLLISISYANVSFDAWQWVTDRINPFK